MNIMILICVIVSIILLFVCLYLITQIALLVQQVAGIDKKQNSLEDAIRKEIALNRSELSKTLDASSNALLKRMTDVASLQGQNLESFAKQLSVLTTLNEDKLNNLRLTLERQLKELQNDNNTKLEQMRATVDEKLQSTLEKRLGESFKMVSDRLEKVHQGLGEMQTLASGVGDLKNVLTNVKSRGTWGEFQLANILEQILSPDQYERNVATKKGSKDFVEFAIKLPGKGEEPTYIPIDSKFPKEDYERLLDAQDKSDFAGVESSLKDLERNIKLEAKKIKEKYIDPPFTTEFAILYLPTEGLYGEVLRRAGLFDFLQRECRIVVAGPTTFSAILNSLQMGFRTLAVEKRASEVWRMLGSVKSEFGKFGDVLEATKRRLDMASKEIDKASVRSRAIERNLRDVQEMPDQLAVPIINEEVQLIETNSESMVD